MSLSLMLLQLIPGNKRARKNLKTANARDTGSVHNVYLLELTMTLSSESTSVSWNRVNGGAVWHSRKKLPRSPVDVPECDANAGFWDKQRMTKD